MQGGTTRTGTLCAAALIAVGLAAPPVAAGDGTITVMREIERRPAFGETPRTTLSVNEVRVSPRDGIFDKLVYDDVSVVAITGREAELIRGSQAIRRLTEAGGTVDRETILRSTSGIGSSAPSRTDFAVIESSISGAMGGAAGAVRGATSGIAGAVQRGLGTLR